MSYIHGRTALSYGLLWTVLDPNLDGLQVLSVRGLPRLSEWPRFAKEQYMWRMRGEA